MPPETFPVLLAVLAVSLLSLVGAVVLLWKGRVKAILPLLIALAAGALLGDTFLHLLPHSVADAGGFTPSIAYGVLAGLLGFFLIEGLLHWHHHGEDVHQHGPEGIHSFGWMNLIGDGLHNFIDGMLIAATWIESPEAGIATTIAVALHEIPQEFGDLGVLIHAGFSQKKALLMNLLSGLAAVLGAVLVLAMAGDDHGMSEFLLPVAAGGFLYIACADLVPEMRKRSKGKELLTTLIALGIGLGLMVAVHEVGCHGHDHSHGHGHHHDGHGHGHGHSHGTDDDGPKDDEGGHGHSHGDGDDGGHGHSHGDDDDGKADGKSPKKEPK